RSVAASLPDAGETISVLNMERCPSLRSRAIARQSLAFEAETSLRYSRLPSEIGWNSGSRGGATVGRAKSVSAESVMRGQTIKAGHGVAQFFYARRWPGRRILKYHHLAA